jgi:hypothetical protein
MTNTLAIVFGFSNPLGLLSDPPGRSPHTELHRLPSLGPRLGRSIVLGLGTLLVGLGGCSQLPPELPRQIVLKQSWELESGDRVGGHLVTGSLGDISVQLRGTRLHAPFTGQVERASKGFHCIYFSSPEVPAYLFRYCGVRRPRLGVLQAGEVMGRGNQIHFATLRRQPDGAWAIVEPSDSVLEQTLNQPAPAFFF